MSVANYVVGDGQPLDIDALDGMDPGDDLDPSPDRDAGFVTGAPWAKAEKPKAKKPKANVKGTWEGEKGSGKSQKQCVKQKTCSEGTKAKAGQKRREKDEVEKKLHSAP